MLTEAPHERSHHTYKGSDKRKGKKTTASVINSCSGGPASGAVRRPPRLDGVQATARLLPRLAPSSLSAPSTYLVHLAVRFLGALQFQFLPSKCGDVHRPAFCRMSRETKLLVESAYGVIATELNLGGESSYLPY